jgi:hypothetical protein
MWRMPKWQIMPFSTNLAWLERRSVVVVPLDLHMTYLRILFEESAQQFVYTLFDLHQSSSGRVYGFSPCAKYKGSAFVPIYPSFYSSSNFLLSMLFFCSEVLPGCLRLVYTLQLYDFYSIYVSLSSPLITAVQ